jgi:hypothetical protein
LPHYIACIHTEPATGILNGTTGMNPNAKDKRPVLQGRCV